MTTATQLETRASRELHERACAVTPGGVNSPVRAMRSVGADWPVAIASGSGATVTDLDGNTYTDWIQSWGALPLGHAHPVVTAAVHAAVDRGSSFGACTEAEVELAELVCDWVPGLERVRFVSSGTEATMSALRVARAATGRDGLVVFEGNYHGHADSFLAAGGSGMATLSIPSSPGVPASVAAETIVAPYNDAATTRALIEASNVEVAAIIVEPVAGNMGAIGPEVNADGTTFLDELRALCDDIGALLILDEVMTGFRVARGGAQERFGVRADLATFGKVIGGGYPVGAFGGRADLMDQVAPAGPVYQAGTLSGNPVAMTAGLATLRELEATDGWARTEALAKRLELAITDGLAELDSPPAWRVARTGPMLTTYHLPAGFDGLPSNFADASQSDVDAFGRTHRHAMAAGHLLPPSQFESWFVTAAHTEADVDALAATIVEAAR